jgi:chemotaxis protein methyltransferase CheR
MSARDESISGRDYTRLCELIYAEAGIHLGTERKTMLEARIRRRLKILNLGSYGQYCDYLFGHMGMKEEIVHLIDVVTTNKTDFYRESAHFDYLVEKALPELTGSLAGRQLLIWSAGCSTGEEAYTIAILIHQSGLFFPRRRTNPDSRPSVAAPDEPPMWDVRIYGSDISRRCVALARRGIYGEGSFRATPDSVRRACFRQGPDGWQVTDSIRHLCHFGQMNLLDEEPGRIFGRVDVIFCRNVLIYFDTKSRKTAIDLLYDRLNPGGVLLLGHSESLLNVSTAFELLHLREDLVYRKPLSTHGPNDVLDDPT